MKYNITLIALAVGVIAQAQTNFETADKAVENMRIGWNAGNRLDSNSGDVENMWIEGWSARTPKDYETAWGQPQITPELIHMFKEAGFNAIRLPVTWYPHMGSVIVDPSMTDWKPIWDTATWTGYDIDPDWMARVKECVDYIMDEGMYCILNVHHDTGASNTAWLRADETVYEQQRERFESLWRTIAEEFKDYGELLLFEGYNEMLDNRSSWCFASYASPAKYNAEEARSAYNAINSYARSFVSAVRATGGNNSHRNLIVSTYGACCGEGTWNSHLVDPLTQLTLPSDLAGEHLIVEVHTYPTPQSAGQAKSVVDQLLSVLKKHLAPKGAPIIIGEWGIGDEKARPYFNTMAEYIVSRCKEEGIATFLWMEAAGGDDCLVPQWTNPGLKDAIVRGYYGEEGYNGIRDTHIDSGAAKCYNLQGIPLREEPKSGLYIKNGRVVFKG